MVKKLVNQILSFEYEEIVFIMMGGLLVVGAMIALAFWLSRKLPNPHDQ